MKAVNEVTISNPNGSISTAVLDLSDDLILTYADVLQAIYEYKDKNIYEPKGVWLNLNQCYELAKEQIKSAGTEDKVKPEDMADSLESIAGVHVFLKGRDAL